MNLKTVLFCVVLTTGIVLSGYFGPWWAPMAYTAMLGALWNVGLKTSIVASGICMGLVYLVLSLMAVGEDASGLVTKTGLLLGGMNTAGLVIITTLVGIISGVLSGWLGNALQGLFKSS